jgi:hypothetical protein
MMEAAEGLLMRLGARQMLTTYLLRKPWWDDMAPNDHSPAHTCQ